MRKRQIDNLTEHQSLTFKNHSIEYAPELGVIVNHQGATMDRNYEYYNQNGILKYGLSSSLYDKNGIEVSHVLYTDSNTITSGRGDKSFDVSRLYREIDGKIPHVSFGAHSVDVKPGKFVNDCSVQTFIRGSGNELGIINVKKKQYSTTKGIDGKIVGDDIYLVKKENPGLIDISDVYAINQDSIKKGDLIAISNQNIFESYGYGSSEIKQILSQSVELDTVKNVR